MEVRTRAREVKMVLPKIVEHEADYQKSSEVAREHNGILIKLENLPQLLNDPKFVKSIESTELYRKIGHTWFWTDTVGTNLSGYYRINPQGKSLDDMFRFISASFDTKAKEVPFNERAYFWIGNQPLSVGIRGSDSDYGRLVVYGYTRFGDAAPVVVVDISAIMHQGREALERLRRNANMQSQPSSTAL